MQNSMTVILNSKKEKSFKAILNLKNNDISSIKFYNGIFENKFFALGIKQKENITKIPLNITNNACEFEIPKEIKIENEILCAVVDVTNAFCPELVLSGSSNSIIENQSIENSFVQSKPKDTSILYEPEPDDKLLNIVEENMMDDLNSKYYDNCCNCKYKKAFYEQGKMCNCSNYQKEINTETTGETDAIKTENQITVNSITEITNNNSFTSGLTLQNTENIKTDDIESEKSFYNQIKNQIDDLFKKYKTDETLQNIIPNSKWVKVTYDNEENYYIFGLIYVEEKVEYICYGVPSYNSKFPPEDIKEFAQWLPVDVNSPNGFGYWICYQKAENGESVVINFI